MVQIFKPNLIDSTIQKTIAPTQMGRHISLTLCIMLPSIFTTLNVWVVNQKNLYGSLQHFMKKIN